MAQNVLVTGSSRGIGRASAIALADRGFGVAVNDRAEGEAFEATVSALAERGARVARAPGDVSDLAVHESLLDAAEGTLGPLTTLVCNAGVPPLERLDVLESTPESFDHCVGVNARAVYFLCQAFARRLLARERDPALHHAIVVVSSINAVAASTGKAEYCVSKAAAAMVAKVFAMRLAGEGIQVFDVQPGVIETDMTVPVIDEYRRRIADEALAAVPQVGRPEDVAATIASAVSGGLPYCAGQVLRPDGGILLERL